MFEISKQFSLCYGHRVYVQRLNSDFTENGDTRCKCRHNHGHEGTIHVFLASNRLDDRSMVTDFKELGWLKTLIDDTMDHKFIIDHNDPMFKHSVVNLFQHAHAAEYDNMTVDIFLQKFTEPVFVPGTDHKIGRIITLGGIKVDSPEYEVLEGYLIVDFVPTSERLSEWMFDIVEAKMQLIKVSVSRIDWYETPKSCSSFSYAEKRVRMRPMSPSPNTNQI